MTATIRPSAVAQHVARRDAAEHATADERIRAALSLHLPHGRRKPRCVECEQAWPCRTARILKGEA